MQQRFLLQILMLAQHFSGITMPIIRSSRVLYSGCCLWYFVLWFSSCWSGVELRVMCPVCRMLQDAAASCSILQHPANRTQHVACFFISCTIFGITEETYVYGYISEPVQCIIQNIFDNTLINCIMQETTLSNV